MEKDKDYYYNAIAEFAMNNDFRMEEYGEPYIGQHFIALINDRSASSTTVSYVLTGHTTKYGSIYTCCYSDLNL